MNQQLKRIKELFGYARTLAKEQGLGVMLGRAAGFARRRLLPRPGRYLPCKKALAAQRAEDTSGFPVISILTPLYNTPQHYLERFLASVQGQTCGAWQLCLADASDEAHAYVGQTVRRLAGDDPRIRYVKIENRGIAANTNRAAALAEGEYLALADHDDELAPTPSIPWAKPSWPGQKTAQNRSFCTATRRCSAAPPKTPMWPTSSPTTPPNT